MNPKALSKEDLSPETVAKERDIAMEQTKATNAGKPINILEKIVEGRVNATLAEICLYRPTLCDGFFHESQPGRQRRGAYPQEDASLASGPVGRLLLFPT